MVLPPVLGNDNNVDAHVHAHTRYNTHILTIIITLQMVIWNNEKTHSGTIPHTVKFGMTHYRLMGSLHSTNCQGMMLWAQT